MRRQGGFQPLVFNQRFTSSGRYFVEGIKKEEVTGVAEEQIVPIAGVFFANGAIVSAHLPYMQVNNGDKETWRYIRDSLLELAKDISRNWLGEDALVWLAKALEEERDGHE